MTRTPSHHCVVIQEPPKVSARQERMNMMMWAFLIFHARNRPKAERETLAWRFLLGWARLGGTADEVPHG